MGNYRSRRDASLSPPDDWAHRQEEFNWAETWSSPLLKPDYITNAITPVAEYEVDDTDYTGEETAYSEPGSATSTGVLSTGQASDEYSSLSPRSSGNLPQTFPTVYPDISASPLDASAQSSGDLWSCMPLGCMPYPSSSMGPRIYSAPDETNQANLYFPNPSAARRRKETSGPPQSIFFADITDSEGRRREVQISDDTGTPDNWIHPSIVKQHGLTRKSFSKPLCYEDASGNIFLSKHYVNLAWFGRDRRRFDMVFHIGSANVANPRLILGNTFVTYRGRARDICRLDPRVRDAKILTQVPITTQEARDIQANGVRADEAAASLEKAREAQSSRKKHHGSTKEKDKKAYSSRH